MVAEDALPSESSEESKPNSAPVDGTAQEEENLSEEDKQLKSELYLCLERLKEKNEELHMPAINMLKDRIREATCSMTSVPKPLKFLKPKFDELVEAYESLDPSKESKKECAAILSVLGMTFGLNCHCLRYRLLCDTDIETWGHEHLAGEICLVSQAPEKFAKDLSDRKEDFLKLARVIVPYFMKHNAEPDAVDLLFELDELKMLEEFVEQDNFQRVGLYLTSCVPYLSEAEDKIFLEVACSLYTKFNEYFLAMRCALQLGNEKLMEKIFDDVKSVEMKKQLGFLLIRHSNCIPARFRQDPDISSIVSNSHLAANFQALARELDILEAKVPEDVYKTYLEPTRPSFSVPMDNDKKHLADAIVNGFINAGFCSDKLYNDSNTATLFRSKEHSLFTAAASAGVIYLWDIDSSLSLFDKHLYSNDDYKKGGAILGCGLMNANVLHDCDPCLALLTDYITAETPYTRLGAILGIGIAYAGTNRTDFMDQFCKPLDDPSSSLELSCMCILCIGLILAGNPDVSFVTKMLQWLMNCDERSLKDPLIRYAALGLSLLYLGHHDDIDAILESVKIFAQPLCNFLTALIIASAFAGTGNVLRIQQLMQMCISAAQDEEAASEKGEKKKREDPLQLQSVSVLGIAVIAMGEDISTEMTFRMFGHLLHYGSQSVKKAVPLGLALISLSNPRLNIMDTLSKFSHDVDQEVAINSIIALGLIGAGTNNARLAAMLRQLAMFHNKDPSNLLAVRIAQGFTHMGKGTMTFNPFHSDRMLLNRNALTGALSFLVALLDPKTAINKQHYSVYFLSLSMMPRLLMVFDESGQKQLNVHVRVGQAVDVVGQAGRPKTITGFQTHTTPVLLSYGERAELVNDEYISMSPILEGFVVLKKNPNPSK